MIDISKVEKRFFRTLNSVVEPLVRRGVGSSRLAPASLILLETTGFKSGQRRRTPLLSLRLGRYRLVGTARGDRSFWVRNLQKNPGTNYFVGGNSRSSEAILIAPDFDNLDSWELSSFISRLTSALVGYTDKGWAFALLVPQEASSE